MSKRVKQYYIKLLIPLLTGVALLFVPLLGDFHIESALVVSLAGCFWAGIRACNKGSIKTDFFKALRIAGQLFLIGVPLLIYSLITGCFSIDGLAFWLLFPLPSVFFGYAIGRLLRIWDIPYRRLLTIIILIAIGVGILTYEFFTYPQVYFFNHVWGSWPGPIYDKVVKMNAATVFFRTITLLWSIVLWHIPILQKQKYASWIVVFSAVAIAFSYTNLTEMGVITPRSYLQNALGGQKQTKHFTLYYDRNFYSEYEINLLAAEHEFYYDQISHRLDLSERESGNKIESYLYANAWQKKQLVGAKFTSYVPVWLSQDQLHIAKQQIKTSLEHELVHVLAKKFGNKVINASWSIGLTEGLAVAIAGRSSKKSTIDEIVASEKPYPTEKQLRQSFSPRGFYSGRSGVNYTTSGSFVKYLLQNYSVDLFKKAYGKGNITEVYPYSWKGLTAAWHQHLDSVSVDSVNKKTANQIFSMPSMFEQECPHKVTKLETAWDHFHYYQAIRDTSRALKWIDRVIAEADSIKPVKSQWSYWHLLAGDVKKVQLAASHKDSAPDLQLLYADAFALNNKMAKADIYLQQAQKLFAEHPLSILKPALDTRMEERQWKIYREMTYHNILPDTTTFLRANYRTKIRSLRKAIEEERWNTVQYYALTLESLPLHKKYFDDYIRLIHELIFQHRKMVVEQWVHKISALSLRARYCERLQQEMAWLKFVDSKQNR